MSGAPHDEVRIAPQKAHAVADSLRRAILIGEIRPGDRLRELELASRFGTSQGPVREALGILHGEGLLIRIPNRGTFATEIREEEVREAYALRALIEGRVARILAPRWSEKEDGELSGCLRAIEEAAGANDRVAMADADLNFHLQLCRLTGMDIHKRLWEILARQIRLYKILVDSTVFTDPAVFPEAHAELLEAFRQRDADEAERRVHKHTRLTLSRLDDISTSAGGASITG